VKFQKRRGQFQVLTAFLIVAILMSALLYANQRLQSNPENEQVTVTKKITETHNAINNLLGFTIGYYGSIIQVTGNQTYAHEKTESYLISGLDSIAHSSVSTGISFKLNNVSITSDWYTRVGKTTGMINLNYDLPSEGINGVRYQRNCSLIVEILKTADSISEIKVTQDQKEPNLSLERDNFYFLGYDKTTRTWSYYNPEIDPYVLNGVYYVNLPSSINPNEYFLKVVDQRGIMAISAYIIGDSGQNKPFTSINYDLTWDPIYAKLNTQPLSIELLQNGTLRWLGEPLDTGGITYAIPPVYVKCIHLNQTINGVNHEVPFQIENWASDYRVPLGLSSNTTIFNGDNLIAFSIDKQTSNIALWWKGSDTSVQTKYAYQTQFPNDNSAAGILDNGLITLDVSRFSGGDGYVLSTTKTSSIQSTSYFMHINSQAPTYGSSPSYVIYHGVVRDIIQQEPEFSGGVNSCPDVFDNVVITLPYNSNYYTYNIRTILVQSNQNRNINQITPIRVVTTSGTAYTENGINLDGTPISSPTPPNVFYNNGAAYQHNWSEYIDGNNRGVGILFRKGNNQKLYAFDNFIGTPSGSLYIDTANKAIEVRPVNLYPANGYQTALDITWSGAVINFGSGQSQDSIYPNTGNIGLWTLAQLPPTITIS
jgi:hypothetical protein